MQDDPNIDRDNKGRGGAKQLWVPKKRQRIHSDGVRSTEVVAEVSKNGKRRKVVLDSTVPRRRWCATCEQRSNEEDRDAPPGKQIKVKWCRFQNLVPIGRECQSCERVRRQFWAGKGQKALNTLLKGDSN